MPRYRNRKINGRSVGEHRLVWERAYGPVPDGCVIHHRNHDPTDNRLENLELMTHQQHSAHHNQRHALTSTCAICGTEFTPLPTKRGRTQTCSRECKIELQRRLAAERYAEVATRDERIRALVAQGVMKKDIAAAFGLSKASVTRITRG